MANDAGAIRAGRAYIELFTTDAKLKAGLAAAQKSMAAFGQRVTSGFKAAEASVSALGASLLKVGLGAAGGLVVASRSFGDYEQALASLRANTGQSRDQVAGLSAEILNLSKVTGQGPTEIAKVMDELAKSGITVEKGLVATTAAVVKFSKVSGLGSEEAANAVTNAMNVFGVDAVEAMDRMSRAADASSISIQDVVMSFSQFAVVGQQAGLTIEDTAAAVALLGNAGVKAGDAGTSLKSLFMMLSAPTETGAKVIEQYGLNFRDAAGEMLDLEGVATELQRGLGGLNAEAKSAAMKDLMGSDAIRAGAIVMEKGAAGIEGFKQSMSGSLTVSQKFAIVMDTLQGSLARLKAGAERASIAIGDALLSSFTGIIEILSGFLAGVENLVAANRELIKIFVPIIAGVIAAGAALAALGVALNLAGALVAALANPFGLLVLGIGAALVALYHFTDALDGFGATWGAIGDLIKKGDLAGAAKVGMLQLELVYRSGTLALLKIWDDWGNAFLEVLHHVNDQAERIMAETWAMMRKGAVLVAAGTNVGLRDMMLAGIEAERQATLDALDARKALQAERRLRSERGVRSAEDALKKAREELARLSEDAKQAGRPFVGPPRPGAPVVPAAEDIARQVGAGLEAAKKTTEARGTFSAREAAQGLGAGETLAAKADKQLDEQKKANKHLEKLVKKATPLVFQ